MAERLTAGATPVPERLTVCGLPAALSASMIEALRVPEEPGLKVTVSVHWPEGASEEPQLLVKAKSAASGPLTSMLERARLALPTLVNVADCGALVVPTPCLEKSILVELKEKPGAGVATTGALPPPPQEILQKTAAMQTNARSASLGRRESSALTSIAHDFPAGVVPASDGFVSWKAGSNLGATRPALRPHYLPPRSIARRYCRIDWAASFELISRPLVVKSWMSLPEFVFPAAWRSISGTRPADRRAGLRCRPDYLASLRRPQELF